MKTEILSLNLISPLFYSPAENLNPFAYGEAARENPEIEILFCFDLDKAQIGSFHPDGDKLLGNLAFAGIRASEKPEADDKFEELPIGKYFFAQKRELLMKEEILTIAVEIQQEALWQRLIPGEKLYLRYLFEDGKTVTQLFRTI